MCSQILFTDNTVAFRIVRVREDAIWIKKPSSPKDNLLLEMLFAYVCIDNSLSVSQFYI